MLNLQRVAQFVAVVEAGGIYRSGAISAAN
ncbi:Uncharacterised protein [Cedecea neteri]|uniref:Uncharacterized protein n=1 Tax=Cedecea neteri TaxID=158822 RepID=A0A2X3IEG9_9ENTR|nr:Uncharacterised protein [Cedecea neteri]